jgi:D-alanyl-D-alanine carboxypeptidase (penicillin-binding protein 5/6)
VRLLVGSLAAATLSGRLLAESDQLLAEKEKINLELEAFVRQWAGFWLATWSALFGVLHGLGVEISAKSGALLDMESGLLMWSKEGEVELPPASLTKIATALTVLEACKVELSEQFEATAGALAQRGGRRPEEAPFALIPDGSSIDLRVGERMSVEALLEGLMIRSGNDAANVLAWHLGGGSIPRFVQTMNEYLRSIGCLHTCFLNPHGAHVPGHVTCARDLAIMSHRAMQHPFFRAIVRKTSYARPATNLQAARAEPNRNRLLRPGPFYDQRVIGIKTGTHSDAGACIVASAELPDREIVAVVLGAVGNERYRDAHKLIQASAQEQKVRRSLLPAGLIGSARAVHGADELLQPAIREDLAHWVYPSAAHTPRLELRLIRSLRPPIESDQPIGQIVAVDHLGQEIASTTVVSAYPVAPTWRYQLSQLWKHWGVWGDRAFLISLLVGLGAWLWALCIRHEESASKRAPLRN